MHWHVQANNGVVIEIHLWRADMMCGIMEVSELKSLLSGYSLHALPEPCFWYFLSIL
jgi:hypothetical protein